MEARSPGKKQGAPRHGRKIVVRCNRSETSAWNCSETMDGNRTTGWIVWRTNRLHQRNVWLGRRSLRRILPLKKHAILKDRNRNPFRFLETRKRLPVAMPVQADRGRAVYFARGCERCVCERMLRNLLFQKEYVLLTASCAVIVIFRDRVALAAKRRAVGVRGERSTVC